MKVWLVSKKQHIHTYNLYRQKCASYRLQLKENIELIYFKWHYYEYIFLTKPNIGRLLKHYQISTI